MVELDGHVGRNVQRYRSASMSQTELANAMRGQGWKWTQPTVALVESGDRPLKLAEAVDVATVLRRPLQDLLVASDAAGELLELTRDTHLAHENLRAAIATYENLRSRLRSVKERVPDADLSEVRAAAEVWSSKSSAAVLEEYEQAVQFLDEAFRGERDGEY